MSAQPASRYLVCEGREIHFMEWGAGHADTVIAWHGLARTCRDMDDIAEHLAQRYRVICPDTIGRGLSQWSPLPEAEYCLGFYVRLAVALVDQLGLDQFHWLGTSMGGAIGTLAAAVQAGIAEVLLNGNLRGKPTLIVAGRSDALVPVNNNARAYTAFNKVVEGAASRLGYIEVANAHHFDSFNTLSGFDTRYISLHVYFNRAMDAMWANLKNGTALPPSQVVRATARGGSAGAAPAVTAANLPALSSTPAANAISFAGTAVSVPD